MRFRPDTAQVTPMEGVLLDKAKALDKLKPANGQWWPSRRRSRERCRHPALGCTTQGSEKRASFPHMWMLRRTKGMA